MTLLGGRHGGVGDQGLVVRGEDDVRRLLLGVSWRRHDGRRMPVCLRLCLHHDLLVLLSVQLRLLLMVQLLLLLMLLHVMLLLALVLQKVEVCSIVGGGGGGRLRWEILRV